MSNKQTTVAPAEQASKQVPTIDTPEFRKALDAWAQTDCDDKVATDSLVAYIESHFAGQPAAPVAGQAGLAKAEHVVSAIAKVLDEQCADEVRNGCSLALEPDDILKIVNECITNLAAPVAATGQAIPDERAAFEDWIKSRVGYPFAGTFTNLMWDAWQARTALGVPAGKVKESPESMANSNARFAIDGAIQYGRENRNQPPSKDHWLYEYWNIGRQLNEAGRTGWDNVTPLATPADAGAGDGMLKWALRELLGALPERRDWFNPDAEKALREILARLSTSAAPVTASDDRKQRDELAAALGLESGVNFAWSYLLGLVENQTQFCEASDGLSTTPAAIRDQTLEEIAKWYGETGWLMDEEDIAGAIRAFKGQSPAPVTAEPVAHVVCIDRKMGQSTIDAAIELGAAVYLAPVSPQPAAQVPSIDRDSVRNEALEDAALLCEAVASDKYDQYKGRGKYAPNNPFRADTYTSGESDGADLCADKIRALKSPAAAHAAHDQKGGGK